MDDFTRGLMEPISREELDRRDTILGAIVGVLWSPLFFWALFEYLNYHR